MLVFYSIVLFIQKTTSTPLLTGLGRAYHHLPKIPMPTLPFLQSLPQGFKLLTIQGEAEET
jgi:hypothetical protein